MKIETKFKVGDLVYFLRNEKIYKGFINQTFINVRSTDILEKCEVEYLDRDNEKIIEDIDADSLFENVKDLVDYLMLDFELREKENE